MINYKLKASTKEEIYIYAKEFFVKQLKISTQRIIESEERYNELVMSFLDTFEQLFYQCVNLQSVGKKNKIQYIHLFYLKSCLFTNCYEIQINLFDEKSYLDNDNLYALWNPKVFIECYQNDMEYFNINAKKNLVGFDYHHYQDIKMKYYDFYLAMIGQFILKEIHNIVALDVYTEVNKEENIQIIFGGYMDKGIQVYPPLEVTI